jgi:glycosyltransferase involved in cell wall biosynthesis
MTKAYIQHGGYPDFWLSPDAWLRFDLPQVEIEVSLFLPHLEFGETPKLVVLTDGVSTSTVEVERGRLTRAILTSIAADLTAIRIISRHDEPNSESDMRSRGVIIHGVVADGHELELAIASEDNRANLDGPPILPGFWAVQRSFDADFYRQQLAGREVVHDPVTDFVAFGWREGLEPNETFSTEFYVSQVPFLRQIDMCPFVHFEQEGRTRGLPGNSAEAARERDARRAENSRMDADWRGRVASFLRGIGLDTAHLNDGIFSRFVLYLFDAEAYRLRRFPDEELSEAELITRYLAFDYRVGKPPGPLFDEAYYVAQASRRRMVLFPGETPFSHWLRLGINAEILPSAVFDSQSYLELNKDLTTYPNWLFEHWVAHGIGENRQFDQNMRVAANFIGKASSRETGTRAFVREISRSPAAHTELARMREFRTSAAFETVVQHALDIDPEVGDVTGTTLSLCAPFFDEDYARFLELVSLLPKRRFESVVLMPFCKLGGADYVAGVLSTSVLELGGDVLILRTELPDWERPDWFSPEVLTLDISAAVTAFASPLRARALYELLRHIGPQRVFNVNSRLAFETFEQFGERLRRQTDLFAYYFCADRTVSGIEAGYPVQYFANLLPCMRGVMLDSWFLSTTLTKRFSLTSRQADKLHVMYTPTDTRPGGEPLVEAQIASQETRERPLVLWAGRFDRQKRFDFLVAIARAMPQVDFECWGKAVLDQPPNLADLPSNLIVHGPFLLYSDLPLANSDGWLYTAEWDGIPTILVELAARGIPIVASAVGGVPEVIDSSTGWPIPPDATCGDYVAAIDNMLADPEERRRRAVALQVRLHHQHSRSEYLAKLMDLLGDNYA